MRNRHCLWEPVENRSGGSVKLTRGARGCPSKLSACARSASARHRIPHPERRPSQEPMVTGPQQVSAYPEEILYEAVHSCEALHLGGRLEAPHLTLALPCRLMGN